MIVIEGRIQCPFCGKKIEEIKYTAYGSRRYKLKIPKREFNLLDEEIYSEGFYFPCCESEIGTSDLKKGVVTLRMLLAEEVLLLPSRYPMKEIHINNTSYYAFKWKGRLYISGKWILSVRGVKRKLYPEIFTPIYRLEIFRAKFPIESGRIDKMTERRLSSLAQTLREKDFVAENWQKVKVSDDDLSVLWKDS